MNVIFWNVQRSGHDEGGWLEDGIAALIETPPIPDAVILCELTNGFADGDLGSRANEWHWEIVPADPVGIGGDYLRDTSLRLAAIQPNGGAFRSVLLGRGMNQARPCLMLTHQVSHQRVIGVHLPAQVTPVLGPAPPFDPSLPVGALNSLAMAAAAGGVAAVSAIVGDMNVNALNYQLAAFDTAMAACPFNPMHRVRSGQATRDAAELDWALVDPGLIHAAVSLFRWPPPAGWNDADFIPGDSAKRSDHSPIRLQW